MSAQLIPDLIKNLKDKACCRQYINQNNFNMISLGFGKKIPTNTSSVTKFYGEWEFGTYHDAWTIKKDDKIILGSSTYYEQIQLDFNSISFGSFLGLKKTAQQVAVVLDNEIEIIFHPLTDSKAGYFHIFLPEKYLLVRMTNGSWYYGKSDIGWNPQPISENLIPFI